MRLLQLFALALLAITARADSYNIYDCAKLGNLCQMLFSPNTQVIPDIAELGHDPTLPGLPECVVDGVGCFFYNPEAVSRDGSVVAVAITDQDGDGYMHTWRRGEGYVGVEFGWALDLTGGSGGPVYAVNNRGEMVGVGCKGYFGFGTAFVSGIGCYNTNVDPTNELEVRYMEQIGAVGFGVPFDINDSGQILMYDGRYPLELVSPFGVAIPEPSTFPLLAVGILLLVSRRRRMA